MPRGRFSSGIRLPIGPGTNGGFALISGDEYISQVIRTAASDFDSDNPFLGRGLGVEAIFANLSDAGWKARQTQIVKDIFARLERAQLAKLKSVEIELGVPDSGQATMHIVYFSIETGTDVTVTTATTRRR